MHELLLYKLDFTLLIYKLGELFMQNAMKKLYFLLTGGVFTFVLFIGMTFLIKPDLQKPISTNSGLSYVSFKIDDNPPKIKIRLIPKKPEKVKELVKERSQITRVQSKALSSLAKPGLLFFNDGLKVALNSSLGHKPWGSSTDDGNQLQPSVRINPTYPVKALRDNIEGYVSLTFDISEVGRPININIIDSNPRGYFEKSARKALKKWKFDPRMVSNSSQQVTLAFQIEKEA
jgi:protein TonB